MHVVRFLQETPTPEHIATLNGVTVTEILGAIPTPGTTATTLLTASEIEHLIERGYTA